MVRLFPLIVWLFCCGCNKAECPRTLLRVTDLDVSSGARTSGRQKQRLTVGQRARVMTTNSGLQTQQTCTTPSLRA